MKQEEVIGGCHAVEALIKHQLRPIYRVYVVKSNRRAMSIIASIGNRVSVIECDTMDSQYSRLNHQGIVAVVGPLHAYTEKDIPTLIRKHVDPQCVLILDQITDPHNLGACLRTADAMGVSFVITPKHNSAKITPTVAKVACGATETIPVVEVTNLVSAMKALKEADFWIYGADVQGESTLDALTYSKRTAIALGAEGDGLRRLTKANCDWLFSIPMYGYVESLNISVATGICLYQVRSKTI